MSKRLNQAVLRDERISRGLTLEQMAECLGLEGEHAVQILTDFESGFRRPKAAVLRAYESLNRQRWQLTELLNAPEWSVSDAGRVIHHNEWPRFVGVVVEDQEHPLQWQFKKAGMPAFALNETCGFRQIVFSLIDHIPSDVDVEDVFSEAVRLAEKNLGANRGQ